MRLTRRSPKSADLEVQTPPSAKRRTFLKYLGLGAAASTPVLASGAQLLSSSGASAHGLFTQYHPTGKPSGMNVLLVHGDFVDGSSWNKVIPLLQEQGHYVLAVQNRLTSLEDDVNTTRQALASLNGPTVLVGHSYGGQVITTAGTYAPNVVALVYIAALAPEQGESVMDLLNRYPPTEGAKHLVPSYLKGFVWIDPPWFPRTFVQDIDPEEARVLAVVQQPAAMETFTAKSGPPAWKKHPSWYLVSQNDRIIQPDDERWMARRIGATTREVPSSHASPVSHPYAVASIILAAAAATRGAKV